MYYIGKSMTVERDITSHQQKVYRKRENIMYLFQLSRSLKNVALKFHSSELIKKTNGWKLSLKVILKFASD